MKTVAAVPVKSLQHTKSRLAAVLSPQDRANIALSMLAHVLSAIEASDAVDSIAVISPNPEELYLPFGVAPLLQSRNGLNQLLEQGREWAIQQKADALIVAFADLPRLTSGEIAGVVQLGETERTVVLAPDRHNRGTNIMLLHPPTLVPFAFGPGSYEKHIQGARRAGAHVEVYRSPGTSLDIDTPDDLMLAELCSPCKQLGIMSYELGSAAL